MEQPRLGGPTSERKGLGCKWEMTSGQACQMKCTRNILGILFHPHVLRIAISHNCFGYYNKFVRIIKPFPLYLHFISVQIQSEKHTL